MFSVQIGVVNVEVKLEICTLLLGMAELTVTERSLLLANGAAAVGVLDLELRFCEVVERGTVVGDARL